MSIVRGWQAMAICISTFPPSLEFEPFMAGHFKEVAYRLNSMPAQNTIDECVNGMSNVAEAAAFCLPRLQKIIKIGPRHLPPTLTELYAIEAVSLDTMATAEDVTSILVERFHLGDSKFYGIFQFFNGVEKLLGRNSLLMEVQAEWNRSAIPILKENQTFCAQMPSIEIKNKVKHASELLKRSRLGKYMAKYIKGAKVMEPSEGFRHRQSVSVEIVSGFTGQFRFKKKLFLQDTSHLPPDRRTQVNLFEYDQAVYDVVNGLYMIEERDAVLLAALKLRVDMENTVMPEEILTEDTVKKFGPQFYIRGYEGAWKDAILKTVAALPLEANMVTCRNDYLDFLRSRCPLYGSSWFFVQLEVDFQMPQEIFLAINSSGVYFVLAKSKEILVHLQYREICSWGYSPSAFSLVVGNMTHNQDHRFFTSQGSEMGDVIQLYITSCNYDSC
ncbi:hypothetical protein O6H91_09G083200 [Diphasiastrum complanatum]|uniref:Uncharacterized protein n=1 Tax=Diphasiastrum complanatum TaxID=34168 RepID=A0ACC2CRV1_DIPCM|nr:hypothetical protein O6H91_09G083200 [Diphasiastrum complanatum]